MLLEKDERDFKDKLQIVILVALLVFGGARQAKVLAALTTSRGPGGGSGARSELPRGVALGYATTHLGERGLREAQGARQIAHQPVVGPVECELTGTLGGNERFDRGRESDRRACCCIWRYGGLRRVRSRAAARDPPSP
jgi:hypothetical protein